jgi:hypothetical protein
VLSHFCYSAQSFSVLQLTQSFFLLCSAILVVVLNHFRELSQFLIVTVNSVILSVVFTHFAKVFSHLSLLNHFSLLEILSAIFPLLSNFLPLEILSVIFHYLAILHASGRRLSHEGSAGGRRLVARSRPREGEPREWGEPGSVNL